MDHIPWPLNQSNSLNCDYTMTQFLITFDISQVINSHDIVINRDAAPLCASYVTKYRTPCFKLFADRMSACQQRLATRQGGMHFVLVFEIKRSYISEN